MDSKTKQGSIGEAKVIATLLEQDYSIFIQFSGKSSIDLIVEKNGEVSRVEVKSTRTLTNNKKNWAVQLKRVRPNRTGNKIINFNSSNCDILAVYIEPEDRVVLFDPKQINVVSQLNIKKEE